MLKGLIGKKIGMTQIFDENGSAIPVTIIEAGPCYVTQIRTEQSDGYSAVQLGFEEVKPKRLTGGQLGHLKRNNVPPLRFLREFRVKNPQFKEGDEVKVSDVFALGERVDVVGTSKGKGFQGAVKRYHLQAAQRRTDSLTGGVGLVLVVPRLHQVECSKAHVSGAHGL